MHVTKLRRFLAVMMCGGLIYVGHGLQSGAVNPVPSLVNTVQAGGVAVSGSPGIQKIYTTAPDGKTLYSWQDNGDGHPRFVGMASTESYEATLHKQNAELRQPERQREAERVLIDPTKAGFKPRTQSDK
jgi:hypothetical protein